MIGPGVYGLPTVATVGATNVVIVDTIRPKETKEQVEVAI
jgi:hypothetical protein